MKKFLVLTAVLFFFQSCSKEEFESPKDPQTTARIQTAFPVEITNAYYESWISGVRSGGSGTNFFMEFKQPLSENLFLSQLYFRGQKTKIATLSELRFVANYRDVVVDPEDLLEGDLSRAANRDEPPIPIGFDEALLEYYDNQQLMYHVISKIEVRESIFEPQ